MDEKLTLFCYMIHGYTYKVEELFILVIKLLIILCIRLALSSNNIS